MNNETFIQHAFIISVLMNIALLLYVRFVIAAKRQVKQRLNRFPSANRKSFSQPLNLN